MRNCRIAAGLQVFGQRADEQPAVFLGGVGPVRGDGQPTSPHSSRKLWRLALGAAPCRQGDVKIPRVVDEIGQVAGRAPLVAELEFAGIDVQHFPQQVLGDAPVEAAGLHDLRLVAGHDQRHAPVALQAPRAETASASSAIWSSVRILHFVDDEGRRSAAATPASLRWPTSVSVRPAAVWSRKKRSSRRRAARQWRRPLRRRSEPRGSIGGGVEMTLAENGFGQAALRQRVAGGEVAPRMWARTSV